MSRRLHSQLFVLALTLLVSLVLSGQVQKTRVTAAAPASQINFPPSLLASIFSKQESEHASPLPNEAQFPKRPQFIKLLVDRLEEQRTYDNTSLPMPEQLSLTLQDGSSNTVSIDFTPNAATPAHAASWSSIVELLVDSLAQVIQRTEQLGYIANFRYGISLETPLLFAGRGLSGTALKSAAG